MSTSSSTPLHSSQIIDLPPPSTLHPTKDPIVDININCVCGKLPMCLRMCLIVNDMFVLFIVLESHHLFHFLRRWWMIWLIVDVFSLISVLPFDSFWHSFLVSFLFCLIVIYILYIFILYFYCICLSSSFQFSMDVVDDIVDC